MFSDIPKLKVTIADSSSYSRLVLASMLQAQPDLDVLDTTPDGISLMASLRLKKPDLVLADLDLQQANRSSLWRQIQMETGVPVLMLCNQDKAEAGYLEKARRLGVFDYIIKPAHRVQPKIRELQQEILEKIRRFSQAKFFPSVSYRNGISVGLKSPSGSVPPKGVVVIGASTGGTQAIEKLVTGLDNHLEGCLLIAVHLPAGFTPSFAKRLQSLTRLKVVEGKAGRRLEAGKIIIAPGGKNMTVVPVLNQPDALQINITKASDLEYDKPSIDLLMRSVAGFFGETALGVVLTGMGKDGTFGLAEIKKHGGFTLAQDQETSAIFGMGKVAIEAGNVEKYCHS